MPVIQLESIIQDSAVALLRWIPDSLQVWALPLMKITFILVVAPVIMMYLTWFERKVLARFQNRLGPDRVGVYGLAQPLADGVKMLLKEDIVPANADRLVHTLAPILALLPAFLLFAVLPVGEGLAPADLNVGLLYLLAVGSVGSFSIFMGGWASHSKYPVIGAMRAVAQIISYEVPQVLSVVTVIMITGSLSLVSIVHAQQVHWFVATPWGFVACLIFFLCGVAEVNRTPFDLSEAESELVGGFHTEYSGMKFALWYMAEFLESFTVCAFTVTLFLGGWYGPPVPSWIVFGLLGFLIIMAKRLHIVAKLIGALLCLGMAYQFGLQLIPSWVWFLAKTYLLMFVLVWFRGTFPRLRMDQLMGLAWKFMLPLALVNIFVAAISYWFPHWKGFLVCCLILIASFWTLMRFNRPASTKQRIYLFAE